MIKVFHLSEISGFRYISARVKKSCSVGLGLLISACVTTPPQQVQAPNTDLQVLAQLDKKDGQWVVINQCTLAPPTIGSGLPTCDKAQIETKWLVYFDVATLMPHRDDYGLTCPAYSLVDNYSRQEKRCKDFAEIYSTTNDPSMWLSSTLNFVRTVGTTGLVGYKLNESAFRQVVESTFPANKRAAVLSAERNKRESAHKQREAMASEVEAGKLAWDQAKAEYDKHEPERRIAEQQQRAELNRKRQAAQESARAAFYATSARPKMLGDTVCSPNNFVGSVEQISGDRIQVSVRGRAAYPDKGQYAPEPHGPFHVEDWNPIRVADGMFTKDLYPISDKYYLFHPIESVTFAEARDLRWELKSDWAQCSYKVTI